MDDIQTILALTSTILGIILVFLKIFESWVKVSGPVKEFLSNRYVWLVTAVLVLFGLYLFIDQDKEVRVAIKTTHNRYVTAMGADRDWLLLAQTETIDDFEKFTMLCQCNGKVAFQTFHTKDGKHRFVTAMGADWDWVLLAETNAQDAYEEFTLLDVNTSEKRHCMEVIEALKDDGEVRIAFQTWHKKEGKNRLVTAMDAAWDWMLRAETNDLRASEKFTLILLSLED
jgi:hypothetical protein